MGYILPEIYESLCEQHDTKLPNVFIETGTFKGGIPHRVMETYGNLKSFEKWITIELGKEICQVASYRYKLFEKNNFDTTKFDPHINEKDIEFDSQGYYFNEKLELHHGDSSEKLEEIINTINEPICFWLDAHAGASKYASGEDDVPLLKELEVIKNHHIKKHIIAIDDAHMFGKSQNDEFGNIICDYSDITYDAVYDYIKTIDERYDIGIYAPYEMEMVLAINK